MSTPTIQQTPAVPPRPSRTTSKDSVADMPMVPPRPSNRHIERSRSPNSGRFDQSPLNTGISPRVSGVSLLSPHDADAHFSDLIDLRNGHQMPSVGQEGMEYSLVAEELKKDQETSPEHTRTVGEDLKLHAPKPSLPASSAKRRVMGVTRTSSDKAAAFGLGKPDERSASRDGLRKKPSINFSTTSEQANLTDDEHGIPEIGQRVPMNPHLGDVQAPSPALSTDGHAKHHNRKLSARGLPPGSYGMHGHGMTSQDELEKAYYKKHPEIHAREHTPFHGQQSDYALSKDDLDKLVRETASRAADRASSVDHHGTPADEVAFWASEEYARASSVDPASRGPSLRIQSDIIHVNDPKHPEYYSYGAEVESPVDNVEGEYNTPILASDEVKKSSTKQAQHPVVRPRLERNDSSYSQDSRPASRPSSRPTSLYSAPPIFDHTRLEDVEEYEPLFPDEAAKNEHEKPVERNKARHHFPGKDLWEDAPHSAHGTAEVSIPDVTEAPFKRRSMNRDSRSMTPAQIFAKHQEELAEKEATGRKHNFLPLVEDKPRQQQTKSDNKCRFPGRDVWEDAPESSLHEAELSESRDVDGKPEVPMRPMKKTGELLRPTVPERPKSRTGSVDDHPKAASAAATDATHVPHVPPRPGRKASSDSKGDETPRPGSAAGVRPVGGKIAALQAGFMSDLNKRLQLGPHSTKKEEPVQQDTPTEQQNKVPLSDARKGRARGPQRRAPTKAPAVATITEENAKNEEAAAVLIISSAQTIWSIDPSDGDFIFAPQEADTTGKEISVQQQPEAEESVLIGSEKPSKPEIIQQESEVTESLLPESVDSEPQVSATDEANKSSQDGNTEENAKLDVAEEEEETEQKDVEEHKKEVEKTRGLEEADAAPAGSNPFEDSEEPEEDEEFHEVEEAAAEGPSGGTSAKDGVDGDSNPRRELEDTKEEEVHHGPKDSNKDLDAAKGTDDSNKPSVQDAQVAQEVEEPVEEEEMIKSYEMVKGTPDSEGTETHHHKDKEHEGEGEVKEELKHEN